MRLDFYKKLSAAGLVVDVFGDCGKHIFPIKYRDDPAFHKILSG